MNTNEVFSCNCGGRTILVSDTVVRHACIRPSQSYGFDGVECTYERVQVSPEITGGAIRYNWFRRYNSIPRAA